MTVTEVRDPRSALVAPTGPAENFADSLRWNAGALLGGLDWLLEKVTGRSAIAELVEPVAGDWASLERGAEAWLHAAEASLAVSENFAAAAQDALSGWSGEAADAFSARATEIADGYVQYGDGCRAMGEVTDALVLLCKTTAEAITGVLGILGDYLTRAMIEASIPIAGWAVGAVDGLISGTKLLRQLERGYRLIQKVLDAIESIRGAIVALEAVALMLARIARATTAITTMQTFASSDDAVHTAFGVAR